MTDRDRDTIPAPDAPQPTNREILDAVEELRALVQKVANMVFSHQEILRNLPCYTVSMENTETQRANGGAE